MTHTPRLFVPLVTPFRADLSVDHEALVRAGLAILEDGADGLAPFGTTSEAASLSVAERVAALDALIEGGVAPDRLIPGTGCAALPDTVALTAHALGRGVRGALMLPPFYFKPVPEDGVHASFAHVIEAVGDQGRPWLYLYHIPQMTGVPITPALVQRLCADFPGVVAGLKDSSGDWEGTRALIEAAPDIEVYSSSEALLPRNVAAGGAGCISASANVNARGIAGLIRALGTPDEAPRLARVAAVRRAFEALPLIPGVKAAVALRLGEPGIARVRPPLVALGPDHQAALRAAHRLCVDEEPARG